MGREESRELQAEGTAGTKLSGSEKLALLRTQEKRPLDRKQNVFWEWPDELHSEEGGKIDNEGWVIIKSEVMIISKSALC